MNMPVPSRFFGLCCLLVLGFAGQSRAQWAPQAFYNTADGLINNRTGTIAQDKAGYMWVGTDNGICCYDGRKFTFFPGRNRRFYFAHSYATFYKDQVVLGTSGEGIALCSRNKIRFKYFKGYEQVYAIAALALNDTAFLLVTIKKNGLLLLRDTLTTVVPLPAAFLDRITGCLVIDKDSKGNIWLGADSALLVFPKGNLEQPVVFRGMSGKYINCLKEGRNGIMYAGSGNSLYSISGPDYTEHTPCRLLFRKDSTCISALETDKDHNIYIGYSYNNEYTLSRISPDGKPTGVLLYNTNYPWDLRFDREENLWVACENGVLKMPQLYMKNHLAEATNYPIAKSGIVLKGGTFFGNIGDKGYLISGGKEIVRMCRQRITAGYLEERFFQTGDGKIWISNYDHYQFTEVHTFRCEVSAAAFDIKENIRDHHHGPQALNMECAASDTLGNSYFAATDGGFWTYRNGRFYPVVTAAGAKPVRDLDAITCTPGGRVWAVNAASGLMELEVLRHNNEYVARPLQVISLDSAKYRGSKKLLIDHKKDIWMTSSRGQGILLFKQDGTGKYALAGNIKPEALSSELIRDIVQDKRGDVYVGTNMGIDKITMLSAGGFRIQKGIFNNYLTGTYIYYLRISGDYLFAGTSGSIAQILLSKFKQVSDPPPVYITGLRVNNAVCDALLTGTQEITCFRSGENTLQFTFLSPSYTNEREVRYKYYLEGVDREWSEPDRNFTTTYSQLQPGRYRFLVQAQNADGIWSIGPATFSFVIRQPFYGQWWFRILAGLAIAAILYGLYRIRIAKVIAVERTRQRISKDLHDDIGSTLSSITLMNALLKKKIGTNPEEASRLAGKVEETSREMIRNISDIVWSTNPGQDSLEQLQFRIRQFAGDIFEPLKITYTIQFDKEILKKELSMELKRDIYLVVKEIMNNAAKYSSAGHFHVSFAAAGLALLITAADDGLGFDATATARGNGLSNIRQRVQKRNGKATLDTLPGKGTTWVILVPL